MEDTLPMYLALGVPEDKFWDSTPSDLKPYIKAYEVRQEIIDFEAWLYGLYNFTAHSVALANSFGKGKHEYPEEPFFQSKHEKQEMTTKDHAENFRAWVDVFNANMERKIGGESNGD